MKRPWISADPAEVPSPKLASDEELERFHRAYYLPLVWRATWKHGLPKEDAKELVQEAFLLALEKLRSDGNPRAWLLRVVDLLATNHRRKLLRRALLLARWCSENDGSSKDGAEERRQERSVGENDY